MIKFFRKLFGKIFYSEKKLILSEILTSNEGASTILEDISATLKAMHGDSKSRGTELKLEVQKVSKDVEGLTKMIYEMVNALSKYFKLEVDFMEKEKEKTEKVPTEHDALF